MKSAGRAIVSPVCVVTSASEMPDATTPVVSAPDLTRRDLEAARADLCAAGRVLELVLVDGDALELEDVQLALAEGAAR